jgi:hypothetical protein
MQLIEENKLKSLDIMGWAERKIGNYFKNMARDALFAPPIFMNTPEKQPSYSLGDAHFGPAKIRGEVAIISSEIDFNEIHRPELGKMARDTFNVLEKFNLNFSVSLTEENNESGFFCESHFTNSADLSEKLIETHKKFKSVPFTGHDWVRIVIFIEPYVTIRHAHKIGLSVSRKLGSISVIIPSTGFCMGYCDGEVDTGNADTFGVALD